MKLLLDTHIFLWFISGNHKLPSSWIDIIRNKENDVYLSVVSIWESIIKFHINKLPLPYPPEEYLPNQRERHQIFSLSIDEDSVRRLASLPSLHRDPFDRMLICQALEKGLTIITVDKIFSKYPVTILNRTHP